MKTFVAKERLAVPRQMLSYLLRDDVDIDDLVRRIDSLEVEEGRIEQPRRRSRAA